MLLQKESGKTALLKGKSAIWLISSVFLIVFLCISYFTFRWLLAPRDLRVTNLTDSSFTLTWGTGIKTKGSVQYWKCSSPTKKNTAYDDRDISNYEVETGEDFVFAEDLRIDKNRYSMHSITVGGLDGETDYCFSISNSIYIYSTVKNTYSDDNYDDFDTVSKLQVETLTERGDDEFLLPSPVYGSIKREDGNGNIEEAVVYVTLQTTLDSVLYKSLPISAITNAEGNWSLDLSNARFEIPPVFENKQVNPDLTEKVLMVDAGNDGMLSAREEEISSSEPFTIILGDMEKEEGKSSESSSLIQFSYAASTSCPGQQVSSTKDGDIDWIVITDSSDTIVSSQDCWECKDADGCGCLYGYANSKAKADLAIGYGDTCPAPTNVSGYDFQGEMDGRDEAEVVEDKLNPSSSSSSSSSGSSSSGSSSSGSSSSSSSSSSGVGACSANVPPVDDSNFDATKIPTWLKEYTGSVTYDCKWFTVGYSGGSQFWTIQGTKSSVLGLGKNAVMRCFDSKLYYVDCGSAGTQGCSVGQNDGCKDSSAWGGTSASSSSSSSSSSASSSSSSSSSVVCDSSKLWYGSCLSSSSVQCWDGFLPEISKDSTTGDEYYICKSTECTTTYLCNSYEDFHLVSCRDSSLELKFYSPDEYKCVSPTSRSDRYKSCDGGKGDSDRGLLAPSSIVSGGLDICFDETWRVFLKDGSTCPSNAPEACICYLDPRANFFYINPGQKCTATKNTSTKLDSSMSPIGLGETCDNYAGCVCFAKSGNKVENYLVTKGQPCVASILENTNIEKFANLGLINKIEAAESEYRNVIYSSETKEYVFEDKGVFEIVDSDGNIYYFNVLEADESIQLYVDKNEDGEYNSGDIILDDEVDTLKVTKLFEDSSYEFKAGLNFVSFPLVPNLNEDDTYFKASDLLEMMNNGLDKGVYSISKFDSSTGQWVILSIKNGRIYGNDDFNIIPGEGYVVYSKEDRLIEIRGNSLNEAVPLSLDNGWNLVGINGSGYPYTAKTLIEHINKTSITVDNVTGWDSETSKYEDFLIQNKSTFGLDFAIDEMKSYFIRVTDGEGKWTP